MRKLARWCFVSVTLCTAPTWADEPIVYAVDPAGSDIHWRVYKAGTFARFGHNHVVSVGELSGQVTRDPDSGAGTFELAIPVAGLVIDDPALRSLYGEDFSSKPSEEDIAGTKGNMLGERVLDAEHYPMLVIQGRVDESASAEATLAVSVELLGRTVPISVPCSIVVDDDVLTASGEFRLTHAELGMEPFNVMLGALAVAPELDFSFDVRATRVE
jgi:hypothetical protein